jgi:anti-sigma regulatory factor (Ser/Thr protein kinase)
MRRLWYGKAETMDWPLLTVALKLPENIVVARHRAWEVATPAGLATSSQTRLAASVSEISRNAIAYAGGGEVASTIARDAPMRLSVRVSDHGPGIGDLDAVLDGRAPDQGSISVRRLVDDFAIVSKPRGPGGSGGTTVTSAHGLPEGAITSAAEPRGVPK